MLDFLTISTRSTKRGTIEIYPKFIIPYKRSSDLMIRGSDFYAIWNEKKGLWSTDEREAIQLIDEELDSYVKEKAPKFEGDMKVLYMRDAETGMIDAWHKYCQKQMRDSFHPLDEKLIFSNSEVNKKDYASRRLNYPLEAGDISAYDELISTLYTEEERHKIEWAIGAIVTGDSKRIQKFLVLYGAAGTGKSTILNIIQQLFDGYYSVFDARALGSSSNSFALESFKSNPLVAIQHDGDLSHIEDNTRLNSLVSHEEMTVNEKFKSAYCNRFNCFLLMGTNKPVKITDAKSGLIRRLIDVTPSGNKLPPKEYKTLYKKVSFELGAIAEHCKEVYLSDPGYYDDYIPVAMLGASNDFYNFVSDSYFIFQNDNGTTMRSAWELYKTYCDDAKISYPFSQRVFKEELKNYFDDYKERYILPDGTRVRSYYLGFKADKFGYEKDPDDQKVTAEPRKEETWLKFDGDISKFDVEFSSCPAQYATAKETPTKKWENVTTKLSDISTEKIHYVKPPDNHVVIDFDIPNQDGGKSLERNLEAASKWPPTYAEVSKSGNGIHLHYIYSGDASKLSRIYDDHIEIKTFTGGSSLRRKLTKFNKLPIATISSGLPLKGDSTVINFEGVKNEKALRTLIKRNLNKEYAAATKPSIDFIYNDLEKAYKSGMKYDVSDMRNAVVSFAANSTHQADYCLKLINKMQFKSDEPSDNKDTDDAPLVFYDVEVFPNLFLVNWKRAGKDQPVIRMINPKPHEIEELVKMRLVGFNCRRYDNHMLYARLMGYTEEQIYKLSQRIIQGNGGFFGEAYNLSYTDVYDFSSKKQSLKKFEIELGIHHQELGLPWDEPVPEELWEKVAEYCDNDVIATEAVFEARKADFVAREILADVAGMTVNDTTNSLSTRIIFGKNRKPQSSFNYRNMGDIPKNASKVVVTKEGILYKDEVDDFTLFDDLGRPVFPGYKYEFGKSTYRGEEVGEGGYVYSEPGIYRNIALLDVASMHPSSIIAEDLFGPEFTKRFMEIVNARIAIKHKDFEIAKTLLGGALAKYLDDESTAADLAQALKIVINSVYGLTSAKFDNPFRDQRNVDNIVAKRGALFMINLKHAVQERGFTVAHIKTDSIKIPNATNDIIQFVMDYGKRYGYNFEHEATYDRMCLVNDAVYIAKMDTADACMKKYGYSPKDCVKDGGKWSATGTQFAVPYVFKTLFSKEPIEFDDMCETKSVTSTLYLDMNEPNPDSHDRKFIGKVGQFTPIKKGCGGGELLRETINAKTGDISYSAPPGTKGYRWLESEALRNSDNLDIVDKSYYTTLVDNAVSEISKYGDFEEFVSDNMLYDYPLDEELPF